MAWLPLFDEFYLDCQKSVARGHPAVEGTPWKNAFFLLPPVQSHQEVVCAVEGTKLRYFGTSRFPTKNSPSNTNMETRPWPRLDGTTIS